MVKTMINIKVKDMDIMTFKCTDENGNQIESITDVSINLSANNIPEATLTIVINELDLDVDANLIYKDLSGNKYKRIE